MWGWLVRAFQFGSPLFTGYFLNDVGDGISKVLPQNIKEKTKNADGSYAWWFLLIVSLVIGGAVYLVLKLLSGMAKGKKKIFGFMLFMLWGASVYSGNGEFITATALVTLTTGAGVVTSANLTFLPERIWYAASTQLSGVKISIQGDGTVFDSDANGLTHVGLNRVIGQVTNGYVLTLGNSLFKNKNVLFEFTNSAAQTPVIYYDSDSQEKNERDRLFLQMAKVPLLVGGNDFVDFATLSLPSLASTDLLTINYADGTTQAGITRNDLQYKLGFTQNVVNTPVYMIDNLDQRIKSVTVLATAAQTGYVQRWAASVRGGAIAGQI